MDLYTITLEERRFFQELARNYLENTERELGRLRKRRLPATIKRGLIKVYQEEINMASMTLLSLDRTKQ